MQKRQNLALTFILLTVFLDAVGIGLIFPVMPDLMMAVTHGSLATAALWGGLITSAFAVMQFLCGPIVGNLSDQFGRRPVLLISLAFMVADYIVMAVAGTVWLLFITRIVAGIASATHSTASAYVADISTQDQRARRFGLVGAAFGMGFVAGPLMGGALATIDPRAPFWAAAGLAAANLIFGYLTLPESLAPENRRRFTLARANPLASFAAIRRLPGLKLLLAVFFIYALTFNVWPAIWSYYGKEAFGWDATWIGISLATFGICMALAQATLVGPITKRLGDRRAAVLGMGFEVSTYTFFAFVTSGFWALWATTISSLGGITGPALQSLMTSKTPADQQGELQGIITSLNALATIVAPLVMTGVFGYFTSAAAPIYLPGAPFLLSAVIMVAGVVLFVAGSRAKPSP